MRSALAALVAAGLGFGVLHLAARRPEGVESVYSEGLFPRVSGLLRGLAAFCPVSLSEVLVVLLIVAVLRLGVRALRDLARGRCGPLKVARSALCRLVRFACWSYVAFLCAWGFQHARLPYAHHAGLELRPANADELAALVTELVADCNRLRSGLDTGDLELRAGPGGADPRLLRGYAVLEAEVPTLSVARPLLRRAWLSPVLSRLGISGIYSPFTAEAHLNGDMPRRSHAFAACHEVAHQKGFAREDEANFIAWQVCDRSGDPAFRYSASSAALSFAAGALATVDLERTRRILEGLSPEVVADSDESRRYWDAHRTKLTEVAVRTNDAYLRSQGQAEGVRSYGRMVDLLLAARRR